MKLIIAGSRDLIVDPLFITNTMDHFTIDRTQIKEVVSGCANGIDSCGELWAKEQLVPIVKFPADWDTHGKAAGPMRNKQMAQYADAALIIMVKGGSPGSKNMKDHMHRMKKKVFVYEVD